MTEKKKLKNDSVGQIRYAWNLLLFARQFEVEVDAPPEIVAECFTGIERKRRGRLDKYYRRTALIETVREGESYTFDLQMMQLEKGRPNTSVKATGSVIYSQEYNKTIVRGNIRLGGFYLGQLLFMLLMSSFYILAIIIDLIQGTLIWLFFSPFVALLMMIMFFPYLKKILYDYDELTYHIQDKINDAQRLAIEKASNQTDLYFTASKESAEFTSKK